MEKNDFINSSSKGNKWYARVPKRKEREGVRRGVGVGWATKCVLVPDMLCHYQI